MDGARTRRNLSVVFPCVREDDGFGGHVDADGEGLGGEEALDEALLEEDLDHLLQEKGREREGWQREREGWERERWERGRER